MILAYEEIVTDRLHYKVVSVCTLHKFRMKNTKDLLVLAH